MLCKLYNWKQTQSKYWSCNYTHRTLHLLNESDSSRVISRIYLNRLQFPKQKRISASSIVIENLLVWRRHQLIITTLSPPAKRFNQCHRANFRSPLAPVPSFRPPLPPFPPPPPSPHSPLAYQGGSSAGNYVVHDRNAGGSRNLSVSRLDAPPEIAIFLPALTPSPPFTAWTGLNDAWKSIASISRALSLVTQSRSANCEIFISRFILPGVFDSFYARGVCSTCCYNPDLFRVIEWLIIRRSVRE